MIICGLKWKCEFGGWGETLAQVEFRDGAETRYIMVTMMDDDWMIALSTNDMLELLDEGENDDESTERMEGNIYDLLPQIIRSPYAFDICFTIRTWWTFPGFDKEDIWESSAEEYISEYAGKDSSEEF